MIYEINKEFPEFYSNLEKAHPELTNKEKQLCGLLLLGLKSQEIANVLYISLQSVNKYRQRLRKKLNLSPNQDISAYLNSFAY
ncbi:MAG: hypothetical protein Kow0068_14950 [Marinilabiliales bacterium]